MNENHEERLLDLLTMSATQNLTAEELAEMQRLEAIYPDLGGESWELAATSLSLANLDIQPMPETLQMKVLAQAENYFGFSRETEKAAESVTLPKRFNLKTELLQESADDEPQKVFEFKPKRNFDWFGLTGWVAAIAASLILAFTFFTGPTEAPEITKNAPPPIQKALTPGEQRDRLLAEAGAEMVKLDLAEPNPKTAKGITGDVIWSNAKQKGFIHLHGIPKNNVATETYQVWVGDSNQANPIDAGIFDVTSDGDVLIPINAKLKVVKPQLFAVTLEKAGGVVVSKLDKLVVAAKVSI